MRNFAIMLAVPLALISSPTLAQTGPIQPFITAEYYMENISMEQFNRDGRELFRSEAAFDLITDYVGGEIGQPLSGSQFLALMRDSTQTRVRNCSTDEMIRTGALRGNQFYWFSRNCRQGEEIVQVLMNERWIDVLSLNCLNAVEDRTPAPPPQLTTYYVPPIPRRPMVIITNTVTPSNDQQSGSAALLVGSSGVTYGGGNTNISVKGKAKASAAVNAAATVGPACPGPCN